MKSAQAILAKVHKVLADGNTDLSLDNVLVKADVGPSEYTKALEVSREVPRKEEMPRTTERCHGQQLEGTEGTELPLL